MYGGPEVTFSQHDFSKAECILFSSSFLPSTFVKLNMICLQVFCYSTFVKLNMICFQVFATDFCKVEHDLSASFLPSTFVKLNMICLQAFCHRLL